MSQIKWVVGYQFMRGKHKSLQLNDACKYTDCCTVVLESAIQCCSHVYWLLHSCSGVCNSMLFARVLIAAQLFCSLQFNAALTCTDCCTVVLEATVVTPAAMDSFLKIAYREILNAVSSNVQSSIDPITTLRFLYKDNMTRCRVPYNKRKCADL